MALIRGLQALFPCPVCLVPAERLSDLSSLYPLRDAAENKAMVELEGSVAYKEEILKEYSLRAVSVSELSLKMQGTHDILERVLGYLVHRYS